MLRRLGIRGKVLAALSVPVLVLTLLAGIVSMQSVQDARTARTVTKLLGVLQDSRAVVTALEEERQKAIPLSNGDLSLDVHAEVENSRDDTDAAIARLERSIAAIDFDTVDPGVQSATKAVVAILDTVGDVRGRVDAQNVPSGSIINNYARLLDQTVAFPKNVADRLDDRRLAAILAAHAAVTGLADAYSVEQVLGAAVLADDGGASLTNLTQMFAGSKVQHAAASEAVRALGLGEGAVVPPLGASWNGAQAYDGYRTLIASGQRSNFDFINAEDWVTAADAEMAAFGPVSEDLRRAEVSRAAAVSSAALRTAVLTIGAAVLAVILSIVTALTIARQIVNPLRRLTEAAGTVRDELPKLVEQVAVPGQTPDMTLAEIPVDSRDEIGQLAVAFNEVNRTTMQVAQEQAALRGSIAEMFVNVARRDQVLLNRQLSFIDALERSEEDPKTLADLFRLDHLATRMRRNAESLLVLAGIDTGRRLRDALPLSDVIRTASSEIEHYERVLLDLPADPMMLGHTALPAAHMMAELLENATVFSEPGTPVQVSTGVEKDAVVITILDQGLGMTPEELFDANEKIRTTSASDVLGSQRLGMFVVGRIAARLGATAVLSLGPDGKGTLATIRMPLALFLDPGSIPLTPVNQHASHVESFVLPEEAAEVVHDTAFAPLPSGVQDVAAGALGSEQNPAQEVDLGALTDGTTGLGLPRRRKTGEDPAPAELSPLTGHREEDDAAAAPSIPLAPRAEALASAAATPLAAEDTWTPPVIAPSAPLVARRGAEAAEAPALPTRGGAGSLPVREPSTASGNLPTRAPSGALPVREPSTGTGNLPVRAASGSLPVREPSTTTGGLPLRASASAPVPHPRTGEQAAVRPTPDTRSAMFSGFRSRRAELAAAAVQVENQGDATSGATEAAGAPDGADRLAAAAAGAAAFFGRGRPDAAAQPAEAEPEPMVIPSFADDDAPATVAPAEQTPVVAEAEQSAEEPTAGTHRARHALPVSDEPAEPWLPAQAEPIEAVWTPPTEAVQSEPWAPVQLEPDEQAWAPDEQAWTPVEPVAEQAQPWAPAEPVAEQQAQPWAPVQGAEQAQPWAPVQGSEQAQPWAPVQAVEQGQPWAPAEAVAEEAQPWAPVQGTEQTQLWAPAQPVAEQQAEPWAAPAQPAEQTQLWAPAQQPAAEPQAWTAPQPFVETPQPWGQAEAEPAPNFAELVQGPSRRDNRPAKRRRGLFGRKPKDVASAAPAVVVPAVASVPVAAPSAAAAPAPVAAVPPTFAPAPVVAAPAVAEPTVAPLRQSAWGPTDTGAHALPPIAPPAPAVAEPAAPAPVADAFAFGGQTPAQAPAPAPAPAPATDSFAALAAAAPVVSSWEPPAVPVAEPASSGAWAPVQGWSTPQAPAHPSVPEPTVPSPHQPVSRQTMFTPEPSSGAFDDEVTNMLAQRADIAQQALAELSQLSSYRPKAATPGAPSTLARRTPGSIPAAPEIKVIPPGQRPERDANQVRSLLSSFQSGTSRGRQVADPDTQSPGGDTPAGNEGGTPVADGASVTAPDTDLSQRSTSW